MVKNLSIVSILLLCSLFIQSAFAYTTLNGCPDFMNIDGSYVEGYAGSFNDPFDSLGIVLNRHTLNQTKKTDPNTGNVLTTIPQGEMKSIRLGNDMIGGEAEAIVYHFIVDPNNSLLFVNFAVVLEDPGHDFIYQPRFVVRITDKDGVLVSKCSEYDVSAAAGLDGFQDYMGGNTAVRWRDWTKIGLDLTPFANQEVQVQFITYDCALMGHFGYAYFTAHCAPNKLELKECAGAGFSVSAPDGFASYLWDNGDTTQTTHRQFSSEDMSIYCEVTSVTGCSFTQSAFVSAASADVETFFKDTICQGEPYTKHNYNLPPQQTVGTTLYNNIILDPSKCAETAETQLELTVLQQFYNIDAAICEGDNYVENGFSIINPPLGTLFDTLRFEKREGRRCDSIVCLKLTISETLHLSNDLVGDAHPCTGVATTYYIDSDNNSTNYSWTLPDNAVIMNGGSSPQIVVYFTDDKPGTIILNGENGCGTGAVPFDVKPRLSYHQFIQDTACVNQIYDKYNFNLGKLSNTGYFTHTQSLKTKQGCDSMVVLALSVFDQPQAWIEVEGDKHLLCASDRVMLIAKGEAGDYVIHNCDSLPVVIGDVYCEDGSIVHLNKFNASKQKAAGVVFYIDPNYEFALVADLKDLYRNQYMTWGGYGYDIPNMENQTQVRQVMCNQDGYGNTAIIRNTGDESIYPTAWAVDFENGWYLPSAGELRLLYSTFHEVNTTLEKIGAEEFPSNANGLYYPFNYASSTELSAYYFCVVTEKGEIMGNSKDIYRGCIRQIKSVKLNKTKDPSVKIGDLVENEYGEKGIAFRMSEDGRSGWMVNLHEDEEYRRWGAQNIQEMKDHRGENPYADYLAANQDWNVEENNRLMKKHTPCIQEYSICYIDTTKGWLLPSAGQLDEIYALLPILDSSLVRNGGEEFYYLSYWTSTKYDSTHAWVYDMAFGKSAIENTNEWAAVRTVSKFTYCEPHAEILDSSLTFEWSNGATTPYLEVFPTQSTTYSMVATSKEGCSVTASKHLLVSQQDTTIIFDTLCYGERYHDELFDVSESGTYTATVENGECNQTVILNLFVEAKTKETIIKDQICQGATYQKNGFTLTANVSGERKDTLRLSNQIGCDSLIILHLNILPMKRDTLFEQICQNESYFENGFSVAAYQNTGMHYYEKRTVNEQGCDVLMTLALRVDSIYQLSMVDSICQYEKYSKNGFDFVAENTGYNNYYVNLKSKTGCDSTLALNLKVFDTHETTFSDTIVVGEGYQSKDFSLPAQNTIGWQRFEKHLSNEHGCDSLIVLNLYVQSDEETLNIPTAFSPLNQNGDNDVFMPGYELYVYDRYGLLVCHSYDGWDGKYRGSFADPGVYIYTMIYKSGKEIHGTIEILGD